MSLATSNLYVRSILQTLGVANQKAIFYNADGSLKTIAQLGALVDKNGLNATYCPGATADDRLSNLRANRNLKYFKGYTPNTAYLTCSPETFSIEWGEDWLEVSINTNQSWTVSESLNWISVDKTSGTGNGMITIYISGNSSSIARHAHIYVSGGGITIDININQAGNADA
jgi:hypothetical protein